MIALNNDELEQINLAARPLPEQVRGEFLAAVAAELQHQPQCGPGVVYRCCRELQRKFFDPPISTGGRYD
jgi:hypothetical protein